MFTTKMALLGFYLYSSLFSSPGASQLAITIKFPSVRDSECPWLRIRIRRKKTKSPEKLIPRDMGLNPRSLSPEQNALSSRSWRHARKADIVKPEPINLEDPSLFTC